jgi:hypothetical protein
MPFTFFIDVILLSICLFTSLSGSAIGIKTQFWAEDSMVIVDLAIERMDRLYVDHDPSALPPITPETRARLDTERAQFQREQGAHEAAVQSRGFHLVSFVAGLAVALALTGWLRNQDKP